MRINRTLCWFAACVFVFGCPASEPPEDRPVDTQTDGAQDMTVAQDPPSDSDGSGEPDADEDSEIGDQAVTSDETDSVEEPDSVADQEDAIPDLSPDIAEDTASEPDISPENVVGAAGGTVTGPNGVELEIPAGSLGSDVEFTVTVSEATTQLFEVVGEIYRFEPEDTTFSVPATVTIPYDESELTSPEGNLLVWWGDTVSSGWEPLASSVVNPADNTISATIEHFSGGAVGFDVSCDTATGCVEGFCEVPLGSCIGMGVCRELPAVCPGAVEPVCGCDFVDYDNVCSANRAGTQVSFEGRCSPGSCEFDFECDDTEYCQLGGACFGLGSCVTVPDSCDGIVSPVCGCDGAQYDNECLAARARQGIAVYGPCPELGPPIHVWSHGFGGACGDRDGCSRADDFARDSALSPSGDLYVIGDVTESFTIGEDPVTVTEPGFADVILLRLTENGDLDWFYTLGSTGTDRGRAVTLDADGYLYIAGEYSAELTIPGCEALTHHAATDIFVVKLDVSGASPVPDWCTSFTGPGFQRLADIAVDGAGNIFVAGSFTGDIALDGSTTLPEFHSTSEFFVAKLTQHAEAPRVRHAWSMASNDGGKQEATSLVLGGDSVFVAVYFQGDMHAGDTLIGDADSYYDAAIIEFAAADGAIGWYDTLTSDPDDGEDDADAIIYDMVFSDARLFLAGSFEGTLLLDTAPRTVLSASDGYDLFAAVLAPSEDGFDLQWGTTVANMGTEAANAIAVDPDGNLYMAGFFDNWIEIGGDRTYSSSEHHSDLFIARYDADEVDGDWDYAWYGAYGLADEDEALSLSVRSPDHLYLSGFFEVQLDLKRPTIPPIASAGHKDMFAIRFESSAD